MRRLMVAAGDRVLSLREAADRLQVHYMTAYRWVRRGDLPAFKAGGRLRVREHDLEAFVAGRAVEVAMPSTTPGRTDWALHVDRLHDRLRTGAETDAAALVHKVLADGATVGDVYTELLTPALHRIGDDWGNGRCSVAEEHRASEIVRALVARHGETFRRPGPARGVAVALTPPGERHGLAIAMIADIVRGSGYDVHHLGADVPIDDLRRFLRTVPCDVACVSVTRRDLDPDALRAVAVTAHGAGVRVIVGGQGADFDSVAAWGFGEVADARSVTHDAPARGR